MKPLNAAERLNAQSKPTWLIGHTLPQAMGKLRRRPELDELVAGLMDSIDLPEYDALPKVIPATSAGAGRMVLAYYHQRGAMPTPQTTAKPSAHVGVDWTSVDWAKTNAELARELGVSPAAVRAARIRHHR